MAEYTKNMTFIPKKITKGATIGLIAPGSFIRKDQLEKTKQSVKKLGFIPYHTPRILNRHGYLAGTDKERIEDLHEMFTNKTVDAILCVRGGYGCTRLLPLIDYKLIKNNPKPLIGYSDITALHISIYKNTSLVGYHAAVGISTYNNYTVKHLMKTLTETANEQIINYEKEPDTDLPEYDCFTITKGAAQGVLIGGNLSLLASMIGTKYDLDYSGKLLFIEEIAEYPYKIDRMLTQMRQAGKFDNIKGIICGVFKSCDIDGNETTKENSFSLKELLTDRLSDLGVPVLYGFSFGHVKNKCTLPIGIEAKLDTEAKIVTLLEKTVC